MVDLKPLDFCMVVFLFLRFFLRILFFRTEYMNCKTWIFFKDYLGKTKELKMATELPPCVYLGDIKNECIPLDTRLFGIQVRDIKVVWHTRLLPKI